MPKNLNTKKAAEFLTGLGIPFSKKTLEIWRSQGRGPKYKRVGGSVFYTESALFEFSKGQSVETEDSLKIRSDQG